jgi:TetR/AcrR family transcriptional regulator
MSKIKQRGERRQQILETLAAMLEDSPGERITTAKLATQVGVSEAALYRHFPSKTKMFEGLIEFIEEAIFSRISVIVSEEPSALRQCEKILTLLLAFVDKNPGITRLLTGDALAGETERLRHRIGQFYDRIETQLKQILREAEMREGIRPVLPISTAANLLLACAEGRISQFVRSEFKRSPTAEWPEQWAILTNGFFRKTMSTPI